MKLEGYGQSPVEQNMAQADWGNMGLSMLRFWLLFEF